MATVRPPGLPEYRPVVEGGAGQAEVEMGGVHENIPYISRAVKILNSELISLNARSFTSIHNKSATHTEEGKAYYKQ